MRIKWDEMEYSCWISPMVRLSTHKSMVISPPTESVCRKGASTFVWPTNMEEKKFSTAENPAGGRLWGERPGRQFEMLPIPLLVWRVVRQGNGRSHTQEIWARLTVPVYFALGLGHGGKPWVEAGGTSSSWCPSSATLLPTERWISEIQVTKIAYVNLWDCDCHDLTSVCFLFH